MESGITGYDICVGVDAESCDVTDFVSVGMRNSYHIMGLALVHHMVYYVTVRATNGAGLQSSSVSESITTDFSPPIIRNMSSGEYLMELKCFQELVSMKWKPLLDSESGIARYEVCIGYLKNVCNIQQWKTVHQQTSYNKVIPKQKRGTKIYATVRAINRAGLMTKIFPTGPCSVNAKPKKVSQFRSSNLPKPLNTVWQSDGTSINLRWSINVNSTIPVTRIQLGVIGGPRSNQSAATLFGKALYGQLILLDFIDLLPWQRNVTLQTPQLKPNQDYHGVVKVYTSEGIYSESISEGVVYDPRSPPRRQLNIKDIAAENERNRWLPGLKLPIFNQTLANPDVLYISDPSEVMVRIQDHNNISQVESLKNSTSRSWSPSQTAQFKIIVTRFTARFNSSNATEIKQEVNRFPGLNDATSSCCGNRSNSNVTFRFDSHFKTATNIDQFGTSLATLTNDLLAVGAKGKVVIFSLKMRRFRPVKSIWEVGLSNRPNIEIASWNNKAAFFYRGTVVLVKIIQKQDDSIAFTGQSIFSNCKTAFESKTTAKLSNNTRCDQSGSWSEKGETADAIALHNNTLAISGRVASAGVIGIFYEKAELGWQFETQLGKEENDLLFGHSLAMNDDYLAVATGTDANCSVILFSKKPGSSWRKSQRIKLRNFIKVLSPLTLKLTSDNTLVVLSAYSKTLFSFKIISPDSPPLPLCKYTSTASEISEKLDISESKGLKSKLVAIGIKKSDNSIGLRLIEIDFSGILHSGHAMKDCLQLELFVAHDARSVSHSRFPVKIHADTVLLGAPSVPSWPTDILRHLGGRVYYSTYCPIDHVRKLVSSLHSYSFYTCETCKRGYRSFGGTSPVCNQCSGRKCSTSENRLLIEEKLCTRKTCNSPIYGNPGWNENERFLSHGSHYTYSTQVIETSRAGVSSSLNIDPFIIDSTLPEIGQVFDGLGTSDSANCSMNETFGEHAQCTSRSLDETDIDFTNNTTEVHARWIDFKDNESDIAEFFWCVGKKPFRDNIRGCKSTGLRTNGSHYGLNLMHGDSYYVTVVACNSAGRCSAAASDGVVIDTTPPVIEYVRDGIMGPDMDFQVRNNALKLKTV